MASAARERRPTLGLFGEVSLLFGCVLVLSSLGSFANRATAEAVTAEALASNVHARPDEGSQPLLAQRSERDRRAFDADTLGALGSPIPSKHWLASIDDEWSDLLGLPEEGRRRPVGATPRSTAPRRSLVFRPSTSATTTTAPCLPKA